MLRTTCSNICERLKKDPNISVITNFGCNANCWYCIWKGHELENVRDETDWFKLEEFLEKYKHKKKVSVSGGGDVLYKYDRYVGWWIKFFEIARRQRLSVDIHTRERFYHSRFWKRINRCVISSDVFDDDVEYFDYLLFHTKLRITHVVTKATTINLIQKYLNFQEISGCQLTIKKLVGFNDGGMYDKIRTKFPALFHLDPGDYNVYFMPDNSIRTEFI